MSSSTLTFLGRDSGFGKNNNSAYLEFNNDLYIIDCGFTVFNILKTKFNFNKYNSINIIITHLHNDHAGSLSQLILYLWFVYNKKATIVSHCSDIKEYLKITGTPSEAYILKKSLKNLQFIKTEHVPYLDAYGFKLAINENNIIYTGDTNTLKPFIPYFNNANEIYIDVSKFGGAHLKIDSIYHDLKKLKEKGIHIYLMHLDDIEYIQKITENEFTLN